MPLEILDTFSTNTNLYLTKYLDLHRLLYLLNHKYLFFNRSDLFEDPYEGIAYKTLIGYKTFKIEPNNPLLPNLEATKIEFKFRKEQYEEQISFQQKSQYINSWFLSDYENIAMWALYSNKDSVAIKVDINKFIAVLKEAIVPYQKANQTYRFICGKINYLPLNYSLEVESLGKYSGFKKDKVFEHEKEWRILIATPQLKSPPTYLALHVEKIFDTIIEITAHPKMENWKFDNIMSLLKLYNLDRFLHPSQIHLRN